MKSISIEQLFISPGHNFFGHHGQPAGMYTSTACQQPCQPRNKNKNFHLREKQKLSELPGPSHSKSDQQ
jgi:hypothetical protein